MKIGNITINNTSDFTEKDGKGGSIQFANTIINNI